MTRSGLWGTAFSGRGKVSILKRHEKSKKSIVGMLHLLQNQRRRQPLFHAKKVCVKVDTGLVPVPGRAVEIVEGEP